MASKAKTEEKIEESQTQEQSEAQEQLKQDVGPAQKYGKEYQDRPGTEEFYVQTDGAIIGGVKQDVNNVVRLTPAEAQNHRNRGVGLTRVDNEDHPSAS